MRYLISFQLNNGSVIFAIGYSVLISYYLNNVDALNYISTVSECYLSRRPIPTIGLSNIVQPFAPLVWLALITSLSILSLLFMSTYYIYKTILQREDLIGHLASPVDFIVKTFASFTEPDGLVWFPNWSAGNVFF